jgi:tripartite-type tricarboxylate transporter receptor subunit TctC
MTFSGILRTALAACAAALVFGASAQDFPARDITLIVPYGPGGTTDPIARQFATLLEKELKVKVNVENRPGGSATIGTGAVVRAKPDGYTIGLGSNSVLAYQPIVNKGLAWHGPDDYQSIAKLVDVPALIVVKADAPWKTFEDFMADARRNPGKVRISVSGVRTSPDLAVQQLNKVANVKIATIPLTGGGGEAMVAVLGGRVEATAGYTPTVRGHVQAGTARVLAVFKKGKYDAFPEATSIPDAGYDVTLPVSYGIIAPKGLPKDVADKLVAASLKVGRSEEFRKFSDQNGLVLDVRGPQDMASEMTQYGKVYGDLLKFLGN